MCEEAELQFSRRRWQRRTAGLGVAADQYCRADCSEDSSREYDRAEVDQRTSVHGEAEQRLRGWVLLVRYVTCLLLPV